jgi:transcription elongation factor Elf1
MPFKNHSKKLEYRRKWYQLNKKSEIAHVSKRKKEIKKWLSEYKKILYCSICGENHPATIDFHHTGKKEKAISKMIVDGYSIDRIKAEIKLCTVLCSNCHRKTHYTEQKPLKS